MGNDIAGGKVTPALEVLDSLQSEESPEMKLCQRKSQKLWLPLLMRMPLSQRNTPAQTSLPTVRLSR
ncbi:hypothetical protein NQZ68_032270 [Dissostichus eleginoides]|nr:hypothetical protein NQZ68_032270 [Dissostichus eleginoides]